MYQTISDTCIQIMPITACCTSSFYLANRTPCKLKIVQYFLRRSQCDRIQVQSQYINYTSQSVHKYSCTTYTIIVITITTSNDIYNMYTMQLMYCGYSLDQGFPIGVHETSKGSTISNFNSILLSCGVHGKQHRGLKGSTNQKWLGTTGLDSRTKRAHKELKRVPSYVSIGDQDQSGNNC